MAGVAPAGAAASRALNPAAVRALPQAALTDLRRRFALLEHIFQVPRVGIGMPLLQSDRPERARGVGELRTAHPAAEVIGSEDPREPLDQDQLAWAWLGP